MGFIAPVATKPWEMANARGAEATSAPPRRAALSAAPSLPDWVNRHLKQSVGLTPHGAPALRCVWSNDRRRFNDALRYPAIRNRWVVEQWHPAEHYGSPADWPEDVNGPYPSRGDYEHLDTIENRGTCECGTKLREVHTPGSRYREFARCEECGTDSEFLEPTRPYLEYLTSLVKQATELVRTLRAEDDKKREREAKREKDLVMLDDSTPFNHQPYVSLSNIPGQVPGCEKESIQ